jgi:hypothetical protein
MCGICKSLIYGRELFVKDIKNRHAYQACHDAFVYAVTKFAINQAHLQAKVMLLVWLCRLCRQTRVLLIECGDRWSKNFMFGTRKEKTAGSGTRGEAQA